MLLIQIFWLYKIILIRISEYTNQRWFVMMGEVFAFIIGKQYFYLWNLKMTTPSLVIYNIFW